jgi:hypothetical protein
MRLSVTLFSNHLKAAVAAEGQWITKVDAYYAEPLLTMSNAERRSLIESCHAIGFEAVLASASLSGGQLRIRCIDMAKAVANIGKMNDLDEQKTATVATAKKGSKR